MHETFCRSIESSFWMTVAFIERRQGTLRCVRPPWGSVCLSFVSLLICLIVSHRVHRCYVLLLLSNLTQCLRIVIIVICIVSSSLARGHTAQVFVVSKQHKAFSNILTRLCSVRAW